MSLYSALFSGVSGLKAEAAAMATVGDNIANINTVGYKNVDTQFSTMVADGKTGPNYVAGGVNAAPRALISQQGQLQASSSSTDLGIDGQGFFVTRSGKGADSSVALTRAGSFTPDKEGYLRNSAGLYLQGWRLDTQGNYNNTGSVAGLEPIRLNDLTGTAASTSSLTLRANLKSTATTFAGTYVAGNMATGAVAPTWSRSFDIYDAQGGSHQMTMGYLKTGPNTWQAEIYMQPPGDVSATNGTAVTNGLMQSGTIKFNPDGSLDKTNSTAALFDPVVPTWTNGAGAQPIVLSLGSDGKLDGLTQFNTDSSAINYTVNGGKLGNVASVQVSDTGKVSALFDDGTSRTVFQLPVATVPNPNALTRVSGNAFAVSEQSGSYAINAPGSLGAGAIQAFKLEASTSDLAQEFTNMIRFQRAYSAASKIITTVDDMLQEVSNLKR